jgi:transcriptional regulator with XRE-family HTH domain
MEYFTALGEKISDARILLGLTQVEVAKELSRENFICEQSTISRIESGQYTGRFVVHYLAYLHKKGNSKGRKIDLNKIVGA